MQLLGTLVLTHQVPQEAAMSAAESIDMLGG